MPQKYREYATTTPLEGYDQLKGFYWKEYQTTITPAFIKYRDRATALAEMFARNPKKLTRKYLTELHDARYEYIALCAKALATYLDKLTLEWAKHTLKQVGITLSKFDLPPQKKGKVQKKLRTAHASKGKSRRKKE